MRHPRYLSAAPALLVGLYAAAWHSRRGARLALLDSPDEVALLAAREGLSVLADDPLIRRACRRRGVRLVETQAKARSPNKSDQARGAGDERPQES